MEEESLAETQRRITELEEQLDNMRTQTADDVASVHRSSVRNTLDLTLQPRKASAVRRAQGRTNGVNVPSPPENKNKLASSRRSTTTMRSVVWSPRGSRIADTDETGGAVPWGGDEAMGRRRSTIHSDATPRRPSTARPGSFSTSDQAGARRELLLLRKEFDALSKQHERMSTKAEEAKAEVRRLRAQADAQEKNALANSRWIECLQLEKEQLESTATQRKAYINKLERKLAAEVKAPEGMERLQLKELVRELQHELDSSSAVLASTQAELTAQQSQVQQLQCALRLHAHDISGSGVQDVQPSMLQEVVRERQEKVELALKLGEQAKEIQSKSEEVERLRQELGEQQEAAAAMEKELEWLRSGQGSKAEAVQADMGAKLRELEAAVASREADLSKMRDQLAQVQEECQRAVEEAKREREARKEETRRADLAVQKSGEEQRRAQQVSETLRATAEALQSAQASAQRHADEMRANTVASLERQAAKLATEAEKTAEARRRVAELEKDLEEMKGRTEKEVESARRQSVAAMEATLQVREGDVERVRKKVAEELRKSDSEIAECKKQLAAQKEELESCAARRTEMSDEITNLHTEIEHFMQVNEGIQSALEEERQHCAKEHTRAAALAHQVTALEAQLERYRSDTTAAEASLRIRVEETLQELQVTIEERDQLKGALHEAMSKCRSLSASQAHLTVETKHLRDQIEEMVKSKAALQRSSMEQLSHLRNQLDKLQLQNRDMEATTARHEANVERLQVLLDSERRSTSALSRQLASLQPSTSALLASHVSPTSSPRAPDTVLLHSPPNPRPSPPASPTHRGDGPSNPLADSHLHSQSSRTHAQSHLPPAKEAIQHPSNVSPLVYTRTPPLSGEDDGARFYGERSVVQGSSIRSEQETEGKLAKAMAARSATRTSSNPLFDFDTEICHEPAEGVVSRREEEKPQQPEAKLLRTAMRWDGGPNQRDVAESERGSPVSSRHERAGTDAVQNNSSKRSPGRSGLGVSGHLKEVQQGLDHCPPTRGTASAVSGLGRNASAVRASLHAATECLLQASSAAANRRTNTETGPLDLPVQSSSWDDSTFSEGRIEEHRGEARAPWRSDEARSERDATLRSRGNNAMEEEKKKDADENDDGAKDALAQVLQGCIGEHCSMRASPNERLDSSQARDVRSEGVRGGKPSWTQRGLTLLELAEVSDEDDEDDFGNVEGIEF